MAKRACWQEIPTELSLERFEEFILPHLTVGQRGPAPKLSLHALFNYILKLLYLGCQWKELPIEKDATGRRVIHHIRIWRTFRRWVFRDSSDGRSATGSDGRLSWPKVGLARA